MKKMTWLIDLGSRNYPEVLKLQRMLVERRIEGSIPDTLLLVEHDDVITLGRRGKPTDVFTTEIPIYSVERGGEATYHGPGQLIGYPIFHLPGWPTSVTGFVRTLEDVLIRSSEDFGVPASRVEGQTGVWVGGKKLASIGLAVKNGVTYHGFAINVHPELTRFTLLRPCGLKGSNMTSLSEVRKQDVGMDEFKEAMLKRFEEVFNTRFEHVDPSTL